FNFFLPGQANFRQNQMPGVTTDFFIIQFHKSKGKHSNAAVKEIKSWGLIQNLLSIKLSFFASVEVNFSNAFCAFRFPLAAALARALVASITIYGSMLGNSVTK